MRPHGLKDTASQACPERHSIAHIAVFSKFNNFADRDKAAAKAAEDTDWNALVSWPALVHVV